MRIKKVIIVIKIFLYSLRYLRYVLWILLINIFTNFRGGVH